MAVPRIENPSAAFFDVKNHTRHHFGAGRHAKRLLRKEMKKLAPRELIAAYNSPIQSSVMTQKNLLCQIQTDNAYLFHGYPVHAQGMPNANPMDTENRGKDHHAPAAPCGWRSLGTA